MTTCLFFGPHECDASFHFIQPCYSINQEHTGIPLASSYQRTISLEASDSATPRERSEHKYTSLIIADVTYVYKEGAALTY